MKINTNYHYPKATNPSFSALRISYDAKEGIDNKRIRFIGAILEAGKKLENTQYMDLQVLGDLSFRIKEKGNVFSGLKGPLSIKLYDQTQLKITGTYDGLDNGDRKRGQLTDYYLDLEKHERAKDLLSKFETMGGIDKFIVLTKLFDEDLVRKNLPELSKEYPKERLIDILFDKFGQLGL